MSFDDDPGAWTVLTSEYLAREPWYTVRVDRVQLPSGTIIPKYWISEYPPWVNVVAVTADEQVVLIRQYRHGIGGVHFEIPAGTTDPGDTSLELAARRELLEETGYSGGTWSPLDDAVGEPRPAEQPDLHVPGRGRDRRGRHRPRRARTSAFTSSRSTRSRR